MVTPSEKGRRMNRAMEERRRMFWALAETPEQREQELAHQLIRMWVRENRAWAVELIGVEEFNRRWKALFTDKDYWIIWENLVQLWKALNSYAGVTLHFVEVN